MGCILGREVVIYVYYVKREGGTTTINRQYIAGESIDVHIGDILKCWIWFDYLIVFAHVAPFQQLVSVDRVWLEGGERRLHVSPPFVNDGVICEVFADKNKIVTLGPQTLTFVYDMPSRVKILL
jgi:hypothetical protein